MMTLWMIYAALVAGLVALGALAIERALRAARLPARWIWAAAIPLSIGLAMRAPMPGASPALAVALPRRNQVSRSAERRRGARFSVRGSTAGEWLDVSRSAQALGASAVARVDDRFAVAMWLTLTTGLALLFFGVHARFMAARSPVAGADLHGAHGPHLVTRRSGGYWPGESADRDSAVAAPRPESDQRLALAHESEHLRAHDPQLLAAACLAVVLFPWNPALWFVVARLRLAIEVDCDRRVLRRGTPAAAYGSLLVSAAELATRFDQARSRWPTTLLI